MLIKRLPNGMFFSNCYIAWENNEGVVIDPGVEVRDILKILNDNSIKLKYIILTHGHVDHICSVDKLREATGAKVMVHENDARALGNARWNASLLFGQNETYSEADILLKGGDSVEVGGQTLQIIHTPGHTSGGICIKADSSLFTGDTLFYMSIGRSDLDDGDKQDLLDSIRNKLMELSDDTIVYPGHGTSTTIGYEKRNNPEI